MSYNVRIVTKKWFGRSAHLISSDQELVIVTENGELHVEAMGVGAVLVVAPGQWVSAQVVGEATAALEKAIA